MMVHRFEKNRIKSFRGLLKKAAKESRYMFSKWLKQQILTSDAQTHDICSRCVFRPSVKRTSAPINIGVTESVNESTVNQDSSSSIENQIVNPTPNRVPNHALVRYAQRAPKAITSDQLHNRMRTRSATATARKAVISRDAVAIAARRGTNAGTAGARFVRRTRLAKPASSVAAVENRKATGMARSRPTRMRSRSTLGRAQQTSAERVPLRYRRGGGLPASRRSSSEVSNATRRIITKCIDDIRRRTRSKSAGSARLSRVQRATQITDQHTNNKAMPIWASKVTNKFDEIHRPRTRSYTANLSASKKLSANQYRLKVPSKLNTSRSNVNVPTKLNTCRSKVNVPTTSKNISRISLAINNNVMNTNKTPLKKTLSKANNKIKLLARNSKISLKNIQLKKDKIQSSKSNIKINRVGLKTQFKVNNKSKSTTTIQKRSNSSIGTLKVVKTSSASNVILGKKRNVKQGKYQIKKQINNKFDSAAKNTIEKSKREPSNNSIEILMQKTERPRTRAFINLQEQNAVTIQVKEDIPSRDNLTFLVKNNAQ